MHPVAAAHSRSNSTGIMLQRISLECLRKTPRSLGCPNQTVRHCLKTVLSSGQWHQDERALSGAHLLIFGKAAEGA